MNKAIIITLLSLISSNNLFSQVDTNAIQLEIKIIKEYEVRDSKTRFAREIKEFNCVVTTDSVNQKDLISRYL
jgi:hypothetical protein